MLWYIQYIRAKVVPTLLMVEHILFKVNKKDDTTNTTVLMSITLNYCCIFLYHVCSLLLSGWRQCVLILRNSHIPLPSECLSYVGMISQFHFLFHQSVTFTHTVQHTWHVFVPSLCPSLCPQQSRHSVPSEVFDHIVRSGSLLVFLSSSYRVPLCCDTQSQ